MTLTPRQLQLVDFVRDYTAENRVSPTYQQIADKLGVSKVTVVCHVEELERKRVIKRRKHASRSLEIIQDSQPSQPSLDLIRRTEAALRTGGCYPNLAKEWLVFLNAAPAAGAASC